MAARRRGARADAARKTRVLCHIPRVLRSSCRVLLLLGLLGCVVAHATESANRVIVLANSADPDSTRIARRYAEVRGVPAANVLALPMPVTETINWSDFVTAVWQPVQDRLVRERWIDAIPMNLVDAVGRTKLAFSGHRISYLVVCRGVPLRIMHDPARYVATPPQTDKTELRTNAAAVDSELALLAHPAPPINGYVDNPLFNDDHPSREDENLVIRVSRLDGPTAEDAMQLVDGAITAERSGLIGRAYVDVGGKDPAGDRWFEAVARMLTALAFDVDVDRSGATFPAAARFDAPVLYFGWYAGALNGPFALPGFRFPPGAIALHLHSYSAETLHSREDYWCGPLVARGVTATVGNVFEPYLVFTHRPELLLRALAAGRTWGEAIAYAQPVLSWQTLAIGDPLYRPFSLSVEEQWSNRSRLTNGELGYVVGRRMLELDAGRKFGEALALGQRVQSDRPSLELGAALAERLARAGDWSAVARVLDGPAREGSLRSDQWALARKVADWLATAGEPAAASARLRSLLAAADYPASLRISALNDAVKYAQAANDTVQRDTWRQQLNQLEDAARRRRGGAK